MAETEAKVNGPVEGEKMFQDPEDPEYQRQMRRPADIDQDMREMDRRKRVEMILNSQMFREELERIIEAQLREGYHPASLLALQQISELVLPHAKFNGSSLKGNSCVIPIADIRGVEAFSYAKGEKLLRCKLAAAYRLIDLFGWSQGIFNHITVRVSQDQEHFLINPFGMLYHELTASSLIKVDMQGNVVEPGTTNFGMNFVGFMIHSAIHAARPDVRCIIHVHIPSCVAVSAMKCGFLPISQESLLVGEVSYHDYQGFVSDPVQKEQLARDLGPINKILVLRNHGVVCCGESIEEAFSNLRNVVLACETQVKLIPLGLDNIVVVSDDVRKKVFEKLQVQGVVGVAKESGDGDAKPEAKERTRKWRNGELEFEAMMRMLDNAGFRTGYIYRQPLSRVEPPKPRSDVEVPPSSSSYTHIFDEDDLLKYSPFKKYMDGRKAQDKTRWLNSPNVYQKVEVLETGTSDPKKITKWVTVDNGQEVEWVAEGSPTHSNPIKIETPHQFVPQNTDPAEFKRKQKEIKANRMQARVTAGPQSHILEGVSWDEIKKMQDATISGTGDQVFLVGAASKGIIQREFQHNAMVYKTPYAKNPFDSITDEELEDYKRIIDKKQRGEPIDEDIDIPALEKRIQEAAARSPVRSPVVGGVPVFPGMEGDGGVRSHPQSPTSPLSDEEVRPRVIKVEKKEAPTRIHAEPQIIVNDGHVFQENSTPIRGAQRSMSARYPQKAPPAIVPTFQRRANSIRENKAHGGEPAVNGDEGKALRSPDHEDNVSAASRSSKEGSPTKEQPGESPKKEKKKKKGLKTPSFLKKKKDKKKKEEVD